MYTDVDSILNAQSGRVPAQERWVSRIDHRVLTREDLCLLYGIWAEDAAASKFLQPENGRAPSLACAA